MEDREIIRSIIEVLQTPGEELSDGQCLDEIIKLIETKYTIDWSKQ
jgi:hypothetical protein